MTTARTPPVDYDAIRTALVVALVQATGLDEGQVMASEPETPNAPRPALPYLSFKTTSVGVRFGDDVLEASGLGWALRGPRMLVISFNAYGESHEQAYGLLALWQSALDAPTTRAQLLTGGLAVWGVGAITDLSALLATAFEGRAQMECRFGVGSYLLVEADTIATVPLVGGPVDADGVSGSVVPEPLTVILEEG